MRIEKKRRLEEKWGVIRWLTEFLEVGVQEEKCNTKGEGEVEQLEQITILEMGVNWRVEKKTCWNSKGK